MKWIKFIIMSIVFCTNTLKAINVSVIPVKNEFVIGEPVVAELIVENNSEKSISYRISPSIITGIGINSPDQGVHVIARRLTMEGSLASYTPLEPNGASKKLIYLTDYVSFDHPAKYNLKIVPHIACQTDSGTDIVEPFNLNCPVSILPENRKYLLDRIAGLAFKIKGSENYWNKIDDLQELVRYSNPEMLATIQSLYQLSDKDFKELIIMLTPRFGANALPFLDGVISGEGDSELIGMAKTMILNLKYKREIGGKAK